MKKLVVGTVFLLCSTAWAQISKNQLFEMSDKGIDESIIVSMVQTNCVNFELNGNNVVELSQRVTPEILRTVVDCIVAKMKAEKTVDAAAEMASGTQTLQQGELMARVESVNLPTASRGAAFDLPSYVEIEIESNKDSFEIERATFQIENANAGPGQPSTIKYHFSGSKDDDDKIRCYQPSGGTKQLVPGEYIGFLYVKSSRKTGFSRKNKDRTDLHKFFIEYKGPGPITIKYLSTEKKMFSSGKDAEVTVHGPVSFFGEEHIRVDGDKTMDELMNLKPAAE